MRVRQLSDELTLDLDHVSGIRLDGERVIVMTGNLKHEIDYPTADLARSHYREMIERWRSYERHALRYAATYTVVTGIAANLVARFFQRRRR